MGMHSWIRPMPFRKDLQDNTALKTKFIRVGVHQMQGGVRANGCSGDLGLLRPFYNQGFCFPSAHLFAHL